MGWVLRLRSGGVFAILKSHSMSIDHHIDFRYAEDNTEILIPPSGTLETFGNTLLRYTLISESMDDVDTCHIRTGRMKLQRPQIITPSSVSSFVAEGFSPEARAFLQHIIETEKDIRILRYGYTLSRETFSEDAVRRPVKEVLEDATKEIRGQHDPYHALVHGIDDPWDMSLVPLFRTIVLSSVSKNLYEMTQQNLFETKRNGLTLDVRQEIESAFSAAMKDSSLIQPLGKLLQKYNVFEVYEERFFSLINRTRR